MGERTNHYDCFWITGFVASCGDRDGRGVAGHGGTDCASLFQHTREHVYAPVLVPACTPPLPRRPSQRPPRSWCVQRPTRPDASLYLLSRLHAEPEITTSLDTPPRRRSTCMGCVPRRFARDIRDGSSPDTADPRSTPLPLFPSRRAAASVALRASPAVRSASPRRRTPPMPLLTSTPRKGTSAT